MKLLNCVLYLVLTALIGFFAGRIIPKKWLNPYAGIFCCFAFEQDGKLYEKLGIRNWQKRVPDMSRIFPSLMPPKNLSGHYEARLPLMIEETCMAEATHIVMSFVGLGCLWIWPGIGGILLALIDILLFNLPFILIQRYNRPRLIRLQQKHLKKTERRMTMRVLILSCDTGGGHNSCAKAIQTAFIEKGHVCDIADSLRFVSQKFSQFMAWGHSTMYRHIPGLFRWGYGTAEKHPGMLREGAAAYNLLAKGTERLYAYLLAGNYDTVICAHVFSSVMVSHLRKKYPISLKTAFVATDYTCSPGAVNEGLDCYFIPSAAQKEEFIARGAPEESLVFSGIPVRKDFYARAQKEQAKLQFGVRPSHTHLLMMCGSMGCGPMQELTKLLSQSMDHTMELSVACGSNRKLRKKLEKEFGNFPNIHIHGFVKDMSVLMDSADLYLTKPGGLSTTEAAVKQLPMVLIDAVAGCEAHNLRHFLSIGGAISEQTPEELTELCLELLRSESRRKQMSDALHTISSQNTTDCICQTLCAHRKEGVR